MPLQMDHLRYQGTYLYQIARWLVRRARHRVLALARPASRYLCHRPVRWAPLALPPRWAVSLRLLPRYLPRQRIRARPYQHLLVQRFPYLIPSCLLLQHLRRPGYIYLHSYLGLSPLVLQALLHLCRHAHARKLFSSLVHQRQHRLERPHRHPLLYLQSHVHMPPAPHLLVIVFIPRPHHLRHLRRRQLRLLPHQFQPL